MRFSQQPHCAITRHLTRAGAIRRRDRISRGICGRAAYLRREPASSRTLRLVRFTGIINRFCLR
eukprot:6183616-Pleurochrysis_carterae.AAC.5